MMDLAAIISAFLAKQSDAGYDHSRLHYGSDLDPEGCARKVAYRIAGTPRDALTVGDEIRFHGGRQWEDLVADALEASGHRLERQVLCRPLRPSAWAFAPGHADILLLEEKRLLEVKAPRAGHFARAGKDPRRLVREGHRWQLSAYFHELRRQGRATSAAWVFLDREGSNAPQVVELDESLLIYEADIIEQEMALSEIMMGRLAGADPSSEPRPDGTIRVEVLKGRGKAPKRTTRATVARFWGCSYCPWQSTCKPGPEEAPHELSAEAHAACVSEAERRWAAGEKRVELELSADESPLWVTGDTFPVQIADTPNPCALCGIDLSTNPGHGHGPQDLAEAFPPDMAMHDTLKATEEEHGLVITEIKGFLEPAAPHFNDKIEEAIEKAEDPKDSAGFNEASLAWTCSCGRQFDTARGLTRHTRTCGPLRDQVAAYSATQALALKLADQALKPLPAGEAIAKLREAVGDTFDGPEGAERIKSLDRREQEFDW